MYRQILLKEANLTGDPFLRLAIFFWVKINGRSKVLMSGSYFLGVTSDTLLSAYVQVGQSRAARCQSAFIVVYKISGCFCLMCRRRQAELWDFRHIGQDGPFPGSLMVGTPCFSLAWRVIDFLWKYSSHFAQYLNYVSFIKWERVRG